MDSVFTFDPATGSSASTRCGDSLYYAPSNLAVGADGSLYITHEDDVGGADTTSYGLPRRADRRHPSGPRSTSPPWAPPPHVRRRRPLDHRPRQGRSRSSSSSSACFSNAADLSVASAFDPATGVARWSTPLPGEPRRRARRPVRRDDRRPARHRHRDVPGPPSTPRPRPRPRAPSPPRPSRSSASRPDGLVIAGADAGNGVNGLVALQSDGTPLLDSTPAPRSAIPAAGGTILALGPGLMWRWTERPARRRGSSRRRSRGAARLDVALASDGSIVGLQCDGTLFGASGLENLERLP